MTTNERSDDRPKQSSDAKDLVVLAAQRQSIVHLIDHAQTELHAIHETIRVQSIAPAAELASRASQDEVERDTEVVNVRRVADPQLAIAAPVLAPKTLAAAGRRALDRTTPALAGHRERGTALSSSLSFCHCY